MIKYIIKDKKNNKIYTIKEKVKDKTKFSIEKFLKSKNIKYYNLESSSDTEDPSESFLIDVNPRNTASIISKLKPYTTFIDAFEGGEYDNLGNELDTIQFILKRSIYADSIKKKINNYK